ncbi:tetratricopeptide repeat protein [Actinomadura sp. KC216]|uniref:nSTAND1 domain-containing NTPase n=1 Tax=Actinomadura sp. KC216 TaxID=2530370 RepID=UPI00104E8889|nr:tetratricopeptide repeat protein [Actinomadura sp. KC216]TDB91113.1 tetratricopeptide repeat protein [Actinomadura sp. KC216]
MSANAPFVGPRPFDTADAAIFLGRADEAAALADAWRGNRLTVLHGPAGVGKTSLLSAGVLPRLGPGPDGGAEVLPIGRPAFTGDFPLAALPDLNRFTFAVLASWFPGEPPTRISGSSIAGLLRRRSPGDRPGRAGGEGPSGRPLLAAVDHADLLFPVDGERARHAARFAEELVAALADCPRLRLLIAVRTENVEELLELLARAGLPPSAASRFPLRPFDPDAAVRTVSGPLAGTGHPLAASARRLVDDLGGAEPGAEPGSDHGIDPALLQIVCRRLWDESASGTGPPIAHLPELVDRILRDHCLGALAATATDHGKYPGTLTEWFRNEFGHRPGAAREGGGRGADEPSGSVMAALLDARLLYAEGRPGRRRYRLRQGRLRPVVRRLDPDAAAAARERPRRLDEAEAAFTVRDLGSARNRARAVTEAATDDRERAAAECLLGTIAYEHGEQRLAIEHYETAARAYGAFGDAAHVGMLLAAVGRLKIGDGPSEAVNRLRAALTRLPGDLFVKTALAHALWYAGRTQAALAILDDALSQDGGTPEALRLRGELLADLGRGGPALRDLDRVNYGDRPSSRAAWALATLTHTGIGPAGTDEVDLIDSADDSGPALLRVARVLRLGGEADTAAGLAERAVRARRPPLPRHLHPEAEKLMTSG